MAYVTPTFRSVSRFDQIGTVTTVVGASGNVVVTLPVGYTSATSYVTMVSHNDTTPGLRASVVQNTAKTFTIYWTGGGATAQPFSWFTTGS